MNKRRYENFVKASTSAIELKTLPHSFPALSGEQAQRLYLEEVKDAKTSSPPPPSTSTRSQQHIPTKRKRQQMKEFSNKDLFMSVQNNDVEVIRNILDSCPSMIGSVDEFGWSLLMMACQANSVDAVKELLNRGADTSISDKGGNTATNLVIKNRNLEIANLLINHRLKSNNCQEKPSITNIKRAKLKEKFNCESCNKVFLDKEEHLASTLHNINASRGKKIPTNYKIPQTNRGYQIMLRGGWDRDLGLGKNGCGTKYPIKTVQKMDKKGLGHEKLKEKSNSNKLVELTPNKQDKESRRNERRLERNFRREFY